MRFHLPTTRLLAASVLALALLAPAAHAKEEFKPTKLPRRGSKAAEAAYKELLQTMTARWLQATTVKRPGKPDIEALAKLPAWAVLRAEGVAALPVLRRLLNEDIVPRKLQEKHLRKLKKDKLIEYEARYFLYAYAQEKVVAGYVAQIVGGLGEAGAPVAEDIARSHPSEVHGSDDPAAHFANKQAIDTLWALGPRAKNAAFFLRRRLEDVRDEVRPDSVEDRDWVERANRRNQFYCRLWLSLLVNMGPEIVDAIADQVVDCLLFGDEKMQDIAFELWLGYEGRHDRFLTARLRARDQRDRRRAPAAFDRYIQHLMKQLRLVDVEPAAWIVPALMALGDAAYEPVRQELETGYRGYAYRALLCRVLGHTKRKAKVAARFLAGLLEDKNPIVRAGALDGLALLGERAKHQAAAIEALREDPDEAVRQAAARALTAITGAPATKAGD